MSKENKNALIVGFALFASTFGAGNLIFPPSVGMAAGDQWLTGLVAFFISAIVLPMAAYLAIFKSGGVQENLAAELGVTFSKIYLFLLLTAVFPFAFPRVSSTMYELGVNVIFPGFPKPVFSILFWGLTLYLTFNPSKVVTTIGAYLTPILLVGLIIIIITSFLRPIGVPQPSASEHVFAESLLGGYQTMDAQGVQLWGAVVMAPLIAMFASERATLRRAVNKSAVIAGVCLGLIYGSLIYMGACGSTLFPPTTEHTALLIGLVDALLGSAGTYTLAFVVSFACLTTAMGAVAGASDAYERMFNHKVSYKTFLIGLSVISAILGIFRVQQIITLAVPVLMVLYPCIIALVALRLIFSDYHPKGKIGAYYGFFYATFAFAILDTLPLIGLSISGLPELLAGLPLASIGTGWLAPAVVCGLAGFFLSGGNKQADPVVA